jgi:hypothetical protein
LVRSNVAFALTGTTGEVPGGLGAGVEAEAVAGGGAAGAQFDGHGMFTVIAEGKGGGAERSTQTFFLVSQRLPSGQSGACATAVGAGFVGSRLVDDEFAGAGCLPFMASVVALDGEFLKRK